MPEEIFNVATCQFAVSGDINYNATQIAELVRRAADGGADIAHFPECAISGYAGTDFESFDKFNWQMLKDKTLEIMALAGQLGLWLVVGSSHRLGEPNKPHNCLYLISPQGKIADRYDKRFCTEIDLLHYTPGNRFVVFNINGLRCAMLICFDLRFPEIYRALYKMGVRCIFQSFYNARQNGPSVHSEIMRQTMQAHAATNNFRVSMSNSCAWYCPYSSCFIQPDGRIAEQLPDHREDLAICTVSLSETFYDPSAPWRDAAVNGILTNGPQHIDDPRSADTTCL